MVAVFLDVVKDAKADTSIGEVPAYGYFDGRHAFVAEKIGAGNDGEDIDSGRETTNAIYIVEGKSRLVMERVVGDWRLENDWFLI